MRNSIYPPLLACAPVIRITLQELDLSQPRLWPQRRFCSKKCKVGRTLQPPDKGVVAIQKA